MNALNSIGNYIRDTWNLISPSFYPTSNARISNYAAESVILSRAEYLRFRKDAPSETICKFAYSIPPNPHEDDNWNLQDIQQMADIKEAWNRALQIVEKRYQNVQDGRISVAEGQLSTCGYPPGSDNCMVGSKNSLGTSIALFPTNEPLDSCIYTLNKHLQPVLKNPPTKETCLSLGYKFMLGKTQISACVGFPSSSFPTEEYEQENQHIQELQQQFGIEEAAAQALSYISTRHEGFKDKFHEIAGGEISTCPRSCEANKITFNCPRSEFLNPCMNDLLHQYLPELLAQTTTLPCIELGYLFHQDGTFELSACADSV